MLIVGERINSSRKSIARAIDARDAAFIQGEAKAQAEAGADFIDVNAGSFEESETDHLRWVIETVREATDRPLCIDSPDPAVIEAVLPMAGDGEIMINSVDLDPARLEGLLPIVTGRGAKVIALCQSAEVSGTTTEEKVDLAGRLVKAATAAGVPLDDLYIDPLVHPVSVNARSAAATLDAVAEIMTRFPGVHTICGLTNVSYGLPNRKLVNRTFLTAAIVRGLDAAILDPTDSRIFSTLRTAAMVAGKDRFCMDYIRAVKAGLIEK